MMLLRVNCLLKYVCLFLHAFWTGFDFIVLFYLSFIYYDYYLLISLLIFYIFLCWLVLCWCCCVLMVPAWEPSSGSEAASLFQGVLAALRAAVLRAEPPAHLHRPEAERGHGLGQQRLQGAGLLLHHGHRGVRLRSPHHPGTQRNGTNTTLSRSHATTGLTLTNIN